MTLYSAFYTFYESVGHVGIFSSKYNAQSAVREHAEKRVKNFHLYDDFEDEVKRELEHYKVYPVVVDKLYKDEIYIEV